MMTILPLLLIVKGVVENLLLSFYQRVRLLTKGKSHTDLGRWSKDAHRLVDYSLPRSWYE